MCRGVVLQSIKRPCITTSIGVYQLTMVEGRTQNKRAYVQVLKQSIRLSEDKKYSRPASDVALGRIKLTHYKHKTYLCRWTRISYDQIRSV